MKDDIRPHGTVFVKCSHPTCGWTFWVEALDPRLPDGPFICGANHTAQARLNASLARLGDAGFEYCGVVGAGVGCSGGSDDGPGATVLRLYDPTLEYRHEHGGQDDNYAKGQFAVFEWQSLGELELASLDPSHYWWTDWDTAWSNRMRLAGGGAEPDPKTEYPEAPNDPN